MHLSHIAPKRMQFPDELRDGELNSAGGPSHLHGDFLRLVSMALLSGRGGAGSGSGRSSAPSRILPLEPCRSVGTQHQLISLVLRSQWRTPIVGHPAVEGCKRGKAFRSVYLDLHHGFHLYVEGAKAST